MLIGGAGGDERAEARHGGAGLADARFVDRVLQAHAYSSRAEAGARTVSAWELSRGAS